MKDIVVLIAVCCITFSATAKPLMNPVNRDTVLTEEKVSYKFTQDENHVHLHISTTDEKTIMSILHLGVSVFFDVKGKKKQNVYIKYPSEPMRPNRKQSKGNRDVPDPFEEEGGRRKKIKEILENDYPQKAEYGYFDEAEEFNILLNNLEVSVSFTYDEVVGLFEYDLILPKDKINTDEKKDLSKLAIGVKTEKVKREGSKEKGLNGNLGGFSLGGQQRGGQRAGGRSGGGQGGGGRGGNSGRGGQGGQRGGPPKSDNSKRPNDVMLDFWFAVNK